MLTEKCRVFKISYDIGPGYWVHLGFLPTYNLNMDRWGDTRAGVSLQNILFDKMVYNLYSIKVCKSATIQYIRSRRSYCKYFEKVWVQPQKLIWRFHKRKRRKSSEKKHIWELKIVEESFRLEY